MAVMKAVIEVRTYRAKSSKRELLLDLLRRRAFPLQRRLGMKILGPFPSQEDDVTLCGYAAFLTKRAEIRSRQPSTKGPTGRRA